jgi:hypothetical protein
MRALRREYGELQGGDAVPAASSWSVTPADARTQTPAISRHRHREPRSSQRVNFAFSSQTSSADPLQYPIKAIRIEHLDIHPSGMRDLQPDEMSPKEALERMYQLKKLV